jgi:subtilase family serine protease
VNGGALTHCGVCNALFGLDPANPSVFFIFGGTSAGSPQWAAITALAAQMAGGRLGFINDALYHINKKPKLNADFHDITDGNNSFTWQIDTAGDTQTVTGYDAASGWDAASGLGSLDVAKLAQDLISTHVGNDGSNL